jgi:hypothetical protein
MEEQVTDETPSIPNEAKFMSALGVDPATVKAGSIKIDWRDGVPVIEWTSMVGVSPQTLGLAFLAAAPAPEDTEGVPPVKQPTDHKPKTAKKTAKKPPARQRTTKGEDGGKP